MQDNYCNLNQSSFNCMIIHPCADAYYHNEGILLPETNKYTSSNNYISRSGRLTVITRALVITCTSQLNWNF